VAYSNDIDEVTEAMVVALREASYTFTMKKVYYGDEEHHPANPSSAVTISLESELEGTNYRMVHTFNGTIVVFHSGLGGNEISRKKCNQQAQEVSDLIHKNTLGGILVASWVSGFSPGYSARDENTVMKSTAIEWRGRSITYG